jgi:hypothetical protein
MSVSNLPNWPSADHCYSKAYRLLEKWGAANYRAAKAVYMGKQTMPCPRPTPEMLSLIDALNRGDEEQIKGIILAGDNYRTY